MTAEPSLDFNRASAAGPLDRLTAELRRWSLGTLLGLLSIAALLVGWRRLAGGLSSELEPLALLSVGAVVAAVALSVRLLWHYLPVGYKSRRVDWLVALLPSSSVLALGAALSVPGTSTAGLIAFWALLTSEEVWAWRPAGWPRLRRGGTAADRSVRADPPRTSSPHPVLPAAADDLPADDVLQQLTRSQAADGSEQLSGWLRMAFAAGQRTASVHVAFCPPFPRTPELTVEQLDGPPTRIKTAQLLPHGTRLDLKLAAMAEEPHSVLLQFSARSKGEG